MSTECGCGLTHSACSLCGAAVEHYRGRPGLTMPAHDLYRRHVCDLPRASRTIECTCGEVVDLLPDGTKLEQGKPHTHRPLTFEAAVEEYEAASIPDSAAATEYQDVTEPEPAPAVRGRWAL